MSFREYIARARITDSPVGDFVADARRDSNLPDASTWSEVETHLRTRRAHTDAISAGRRVWRNYQASRRRKGQT